MNCTRQVLTAVNVQYAAMARYQDENGAFRMWPESEPSVWLTAYILRTLWLASFQVRAHFRQNKYLSLQEGNFAQMQPTSELPFLFSFMLFTVNVQYYYYNCSFLYVRF